MLRTQGLSFDKIAQKLQLSKHTLIDWSRDLAPELQVLRALKIETLQAEVLAQHEQRLQLIHDQMDRVRKELATRDLKTLSTATLFRLLLTHIQALKREALDPFAALKDLDLSKINPVLLLTPEDGPLTNLPRQQGIESSPAPERTKSAPESAPSVPHAPRNAERTISAPKSTGDDLDPRLDDLIRYSPAEKARAQALIDRCQATERHRG
jgi:hypothetical protein